MRLQQAFAAAAVMLLAGCATPPPAVDPSLFPPGTSPRPMTAGPRITLVIAPELSQTVARSKVLAGFVPQLDLPIGQIVERAGTEVLAAQSPPAADDSLRAVVDAVDCTLSNHVKWFLPVPYLGIIGDSSTDVRVTMSLRVIDGGGRVLIERGYHSGPQVLASQFGGKEDPRSAIRRMVHEAAWQLWQQAADDIRHWLADERMRERLL